MASTPPGALLDARLSGARSQEMFRVLLNALSYPGRVYDLPSWCSDAIPPAAWLALALADVDVATATDDPELASLIADATRAPITEIGDAWVLALQTLSADVIDRIQTGTALAPEDGARVGVAVSALAGADAVENTEVVVRLTGPGVDGEITLGIDGLNADMIARLGASTGSFPTGFDTWLFAANDVVAIPRTATVELVSKEV